MQIKRIVKIIILSVFMLAAIITGIVMYQRLSYNKEVFDTDIYDFIPNSATSVLQINRAADNLYPFLGELQPTISRLQPLSYPQYVVNNNSDRAFVSKISKEQEIDIKNLLTNEIYPNFKAKELSYKDATIYFYPSDEEKFFACIFHKGIFACSYKYKLLEQIIDSEQEMAFFSGLDFEQFKEKTSTAFVANLFVKDKDKDTKAVFNYLESTGNIQLDGYAVPSALVLGKMCDTAEDIHLKVNTSLSIFPDSLSAFEVQNNTAIVADSEACWFTVPSYKFYLKGAKCGPVYALRFLKSRFRVFDMMDNIERNLSNQPLHLFGSINRTKYNLYKGSLEFSKEFFKQDRVTYFSFVDGYLVFSACEEELVGFVSSYRNVEKIKSPDIHIESPDVTYYYYCWGRPTIDSHMLLPNNYFPDNESNSVTVIQGKPERDMLKISVSINNYK
ncbi:hypothetical protein [Dysgonomonas sp. 520]|uniref:hypothetical protein n=1 Tax=Dysgonomonas sp. 520 TaxID=2302931 RepID=UPI0013D44380|nr:hypothetical protein [Dysgonomonas sp. 520]NDW10746.1 hypothetical protein [Dysgonomonas sp. 520]